MVKKKKSQSAKAAEVAQATPDSKLPELLPGPWYLRTITLALFGAVLFFFSFTPYGLSAIGWIATVPFLILVRQNRLLGKRPYRAIWLAAALAWLAMLEGIRRPFWALYFGWFALSIYAAAYIPLFVGAARILVHRWRWPVAVAAPVVWIGLELARGYLFSGFSVGLLAHTQFQNPIVIQIADLFGQCGVSFLVIAPAAVVVSLLPHSWIDGNAVPHGAAEPLRTGRLRTEPLAPRLICALATVLLLAATLAYGAHRLRESDEIAKSAETLKVALIQGNTNVVFDEKKAREYITRQWKQCKELTIEAGERFPQLDLVVLPESCFSDTETLDMRVQGPLQPAPSSGASPDELEQYLIRQWTNPFLKKCRTFTQQFRLTSVHDDSKAPHTKFLAGTGTIEVGPGDKDVAYNSAIFLDADGKIESRYYKMHRVMFGEYIPIVDLFPILYRYTPLPAAIRPGGKPTALRVENWVLCPNICFESTVPQLVRRQSQILAQEMAPPDALVNLTNDGWFWGSAVQDLHLHCAIFRALENRRPFIVAANSGFSVHCDAAGRIQSLGKRRKAEVLAVTLSKDHRTTLYYQWGDWPVSGCLLTAIAALFLEAAIRRGYLPNWG